MPTREEVQRYIAEAATRQARAIAVAQERFQAVRKFWRERCPHGTWRFYAPNSAHAWTCEHCTALPDRDTANLLFFIRRGVMLSGTIYSVTFGPDGTFSVMLDGNIQQVSITGTLQV
jgi:hypothetical protein